MRGQNGVTPQKDFKLFLVQSFTAYWNLHFLVPSYTNLTGKLNAGALAPLPRRKRVNTFDALVPRKL